MRASLFQLVGGNRSKYYKRVHSTCIHSCISITHTHKHSYAHTHIHMYCVVMSHSGFKQVYTRLKVWSNRKLQQKRDVLQPSAKLRGKFFRFWWIAISWAEHERIISLTTNRLRHFFLWSNNRSSCSSLIQ